MDKPHQHVPLRRIVRLRYAAPRTGPIDHDYSHNDSDTLSCVIADSHIFQIRKWSPACVVKSVELRIIEKRSFREKMTGVRIIGGCLQGTTSKFRDNICPRGAFIGNVQNSPLLQSAVTRHIGNSYYHSCKIGVSVLSRLHANIDRAT